MGSRKITEARRIKPLEEKKSQCYKISMNFNLKNQSHVLWWSLFSIAFLVDLFIWWPGILRPDSMGQLSQAQQGAFSGDHHPPIMGHVLVPFKRNLSLTRPHASDSPRAFIQRCFLVESMF